MPTFEVSLADGRRFEIEADKEPTPYELEKAIGASQPVQPEQVAALETSKSGSILDSAARGLARVAADIPGGLGYLTGSETLQRAGDTIETGINNTFPVNPIFANDFATKAAGAVGQAGSMLATGGTGGIIAKVAGGTVRTGAEIAALAAGGAGGARQGGQTADELGITGLNKAAMVAGFGAAEVLAEKIPFGLGAETAAARRLLGDTVESGLVSIPASMATEGLEEGATQIAQNALTIGLAPVGAQTPDILSGVGESMKLGAVGGGVFGLVNTATPNPSAKPVGQPQTQTTPSNENDLRSQEGRQGQWRPEGLLNPATGAASVPLPSTPTVDVLSGVPFAFDGKQWGKMPDATVEGESVDAPFVPLNPNDPVESEMIVQLDSRRRARERQQTPSPQPGAAVSPTPETNAAASITTGTQPPGQSGTKDAVPSSAIAPADGKVESGKPSQKPTADTLIDHTETDIITAIKGEIGRIGQVNDGPEWDWYRALEKEAATSKLKPQSAEAAARRGEVDDPAALLAWVNMNVVDRNGGRALDEAQNELADLPNQSFDFTDGLGSAILDAIGQRAKARANGTADEQMAKLEQQQIETEKQTDRAFLAHTAKSAGTAISGDMLAQQVAVGSTVRIGGRDFTVTDFDDGNGTVQLTDPTGEFGVQDLAPDDVVPVEQVDETTFPLPEATGFTNLDVSGTTAGFLNTDIIAEATRLIKSKVIDFAKWSAEMVKKFGTAIRDYLQGVWQAAMKTSRVGAINPSGRAQPLTEPVATTVGEKPIGSLAIGDELESADGQPSSVTGIYPQGEKRVYLITLEDGRTVRATEEHLWNCRTNGREHTFRTWEIAALMQSGTVELPVAA